MHCKILNIICQVFNFHLNDPCPAVFSCEEAALEVLMSLCLSVCVCVRYQVEIQPVNRGMYRGRTSQVTCTEMDITYERNVQGRTLHMRGIYRDGYYM